MTASKIQAYFRQLNIEQSRYMSNVIDFLGNLSETMKPADADYTVDVKPVMNEGMLVHYNNLQTDMCEGTLRVRGDADTQTTVIDGIDIDEAELNTVLFGPIVDQLCDALDPTNISYEIDLAELSVRRSVDEPLKLFVWEGVLCDYTASVIFALAHDPDEARRAGGRFDERR